MDLKVDLDEDHDNGNMPRAVENAIRGCGPCSPEPEPGTGGGMQWIFSPFICCLYICYIYFTGVEDVLMEVKDLSTGVYGEPYKVRYCNVYC